MIGLHGGEKLQKPLKVYGIDAVVVNAVRNIMEGFILGVEIRDGKNNAVGCVSIINRNLVHLRDHKIIKKEQIGKFDKLP